jgi:WD40 repeat protein
VVFDTTTFQRQFPVPGDLAVSVAFSPDSQLLAISSVQQDRIRLWNLPANREVAVLHNPIAALAFSGDGSALVGVSCIRVRTWHLAGSGEKMILARHGKGINGLAFSPDGERLASAGKDRTVKIWNPTTGQMIKELSGFRDQLETIAFSPDGRLLATGDSSGDIQIWDVASGRKRGGPTGHGMGPAIWAVAFSPGGRYFAACGSPGGVTVLRTSPDGANQVNGAVLGMEPVARPCSGRASSLAFSPDDELLAWVEDFSTVHLWELRMSRERPFPPVRLVGGVRSIAFHPDGKHLVFVAETGAVETWDVATGQKAWSVPTGQKPVSVGAVTLGEKCAAGIIALSSKGRWLASGYSRCVTVWDMANRGLLIELPEEQAVTNSLAWSPNQELLAVGTADGGLVIWSLPKIKAQLDTMGLGW